MLKKKKVQFYKNTLKECIVLVNDKIKDADLTLKESLLSLKENLLYRKFDVNTFEQDVLKFFKLKDDLNE